MFPEKYHTQTCPPPSRILSQNPCQINIHYASFHILWKMWSSWIHRNDWTFLRHLTSLLLTKPSEIRIIAYWGDTKDQNSLWCHFLPTVGISVKTISPFSITTNIQLPPTPWLFRSCRLKKWKIILSILLLHVQMTDKKKRKNLEEYVVTLLLGFNFSKE